ncbi:retrotransposon protein [Cucumis melo var. makuwa]|uniref:Retrotransposon protein n=1 Tax=Cucumis melo var. makuwa TaxID=1194695 RepID=A0A5D3DT73_CUCMM|nr:retrotransposon protein [Cucumis melo var. makuwa]
MSTSFCAPKHVWTKEEEDTFVECLIELVSMGDEIPSYHTANELLNKLFPYYDELAYVFGRDRTMDRFAETFVDVGSNEPVGYEGFDMLDGNEEFPSV